MSLPCQNPACDENGTYVYAVTCIEFGQVNMTNVNAVRVLGELGLDPDEGYCEAEDFLGRILLATAITPYDAGVPSVQDHTPGGPTVIDCGRGEGYLQDRFGDLREIADQAVELGRGVVWA